MNNISIDSQTKSTVDHSASNQHPLKSSNFDHFSVLLSRSQASEIQKFLPVGFSLASFNKRSARSGKPKGEVADFEVIDEILDEAPKRRVREGDDIKKKSTRRSKELAEKLKKILILLKCKKSSKPFMCNDFGSGKNEAKPINLLTIEQKIRNEEYIDFNEFESEVRGIWKVALKEHSKNTDINNAAQEMISIFDKLTRPEDCSDNENDTDSQYQPQKKRNVKRPTPDSQSTTQKKPKERTQSSSKPLTFIEKKTLSMQIRQLPSEYMWDILKIVSPDSGDKPEIEFDINTLPPKIARELERFVQKKSGQENKKIRKGGCFVQKNSSNTTQTPNDQAFPSLSKLPTRKKEVQGLDEETKEVEFLDVLDCENTIVQPRLSKCESLSDSSFISDLDD
jgi:hypothetical protein